LRTVNYSEGRKESLVYDICRNETSTIVFSYTAIGNYLHLPKGGEGREDQDIPQRMPSCPIRPARYKYART